MGAAGAGGASTPQATAPRVKRPATAKTIKNLVARFKVSGWRRQRRRDLLSSSRQLKIHQPLVLFLLDVLFGRYGVRVCGERGELRRPLVRAAHQLSVVENSVGVYCHHRHLPRDFQVSQHGADGLCGDHVGVTVLFDIRFNRLRGFIVGDDVEVDFRKLSWRWGSASATQRDTPVTRWRTKINERAGRLLPDRRRIPPCRWPVSWRTAGFVRLS